MSNNKTFHIIVHGRVQGVGFRYFVREKAFEYDLTGWVKNCSDLTVEMEVEGNTEAICIFIDLLKIGNGYSRIDHLYQSQVSPIRNYSSFKIKY